MTITTTSLSRGGHEARRRGFALIAVLWVTVMVVVLGASVSLAARRSVRTARNRRSYTRALWMAGGCLERARAAIADALVADASNAASALGKRGHVSAWSMLDDIVASSARSLASRCDVTARPLGDAVDVNSADEPVLRAVLGAVHLAPARVDSLTAALLDWRDKDDDPRSAGAESAWYRDHGRSPPRNGPLASLAELRLVRGFESPEVFDSLLSVEPVRIALSRAPERVLALLPGMTPEAVAVISERRKSGGLGEDLLVLGGELSRAARDSIAAHYSELSAMVTTEPDGWLLEARASDEGSPVRVGIELKIVRSGNRPAVVRRRVRWL